MFVNENSWQTRLDKYYYITMIIHGRSTLLSTKNR